MDVRKRIDVVASASNLGCAPTCASRARVRRNVLRAEGTFSDLRREPPDRGREARQVRLELLLVLVGVQVDVLDDRRLQLLDRARLVLLVGPQQRGVRVAQVLHEAAHPLGHAVLEALGDVLPVERVEDAADQPQRLHHDARLSRARADVGAREVLAHRLEEREQRRVQLLEHELEVGEERVALEHVP